MKYSRNYLEANDKKILYIKIHGTIKVVIRDIYNLKY